MEIVIMGWGGRRAVIASVEIAYDETDHWFESHDGDVYDEASIPEAHAWRMKSVSDTLLSSARAVVSNVSHLAHRVERFVDMAERRVVAIELTADHGTAHDVTPEKR